MNTRIFLLCCILFLAFAIPQQSSWAQKSWLGKAAKDLWESMIQSTQKEVTTLDKRIQTATVEKIPQGTLRPIKARDAHLKERLRKLPENPTTEDIASLAWERADQETQDRIRAEVEKLEARLNEEAKQIGEEEGIAKKCNARLAGVLLKAACYCLTRKTETDNWPDAEELTQVVESSLGKAGIECMTSRLPRRVAETVEPWVKSFLGAVMREPVRKPQALVEMKKTVPYQVVHCVCMGK
jgi:hypothetical protein